MGNQFCKLLLHLFFFFSAPCFAQTYYSNIKTFSEADGFNITEGGYISQDSKGFIWIASRNGLYRFNGTSFKHYNHISSDSFSLPASQVNFCYQDKDGDYWVGVAGKGLYRFDDKTEKFTAWKNKNSSEIDMSQLYNVVAPFEDSHGQLWMSAATIGIVRINKKENTVKLFNVCDQDNPVDLYRSCRWITKFSEDANGWFWLCSNGGLIHFNPNNGNFKIYRSNIKEVISYFKDSEGQQWIGTWGNGLQKTDTNSVKWQQYLWANKTPGTTNIVTGITEKDKDHLWISSMDAGIMLFDKTNGRFLRVASQNPNEKSLTNAQSLIKDKDGNVWIAGKQQLGRINANNFFQYARLGNAGIKTAKAVSCFLHLPGDSLVFVGAIYASEGLHLYNLNKGSVRVIKLQLHRETEDITDIFSDTKNQIWLATSGGIYLFDRKTLQAKPFIVPSKKYEAYFKTSIIKILEDKKHRLWFASRWHGLFYFDAQTKDVIHYSFDSLGKHHIPLDQIEYASFDDHENLWVGTHAYLHGQPSVFCLQSNGNVVSYDKNIPLNSVFQIEATKENKIIAVTSSLGMYEIKSALQQNETIRHFSEDDGIADSFIEGFAKDKNGNIWITTHNGLSCMTHKGEFLNYHTVDGLANNKIEGRPYIDEDGNLFLPFENGFQFFNADSLLNHHSSVGPVILESLTINQKKYSGNPNYLQQLSLDYNENNLSLEFAAFDLSQGDRLQYAYQLQGSDTKWNNLGTSRRLFFSNLSPGEYRLKLRAGDRFGNWSNQELILPVTIHAPFWKTWWFYALCLLAAIALVYFIYRIRLNGILAEQKLRNKIARDLHDDIGSTLSGIKLFSNMAQTKLAEEKSSALNIVERIGERSEKMMDAMSDIVWSINPKNDSIENMLVRMKQYAAEMLEPKNISYQFAVDERLVKIKLSLETRKDVYLIFKEGINNAVKHSNCHNVLVELKLHHKFFEMNIADDGIGFDITNNEHGNGLINFKERAKRMGGQIAIDSKPQKGTSIALALPLT